jgi:hypothetical protein
MLFWNIDGYTYTSCQAQGAQNFFHKFLYSHQFYCPYVWLEYFIKIFLCSLCNLLLKVDRAPYKVEHWDVLLSIMWLVIEVRKGILEGWSYAYAHHTYGKMLVKVIDFHKGFD